MNFIVLFCIIIVFAGQKTTIARFVQNSNSAEGFDNFKYPVARRNESVIDYLHGIKVADPYRWLEDVNSEETKQFAAAENEISESFIRNGDEYQKIYEKLTAMWNYPKYFVPKRHGKFYFSFKNTGLQNQNVLYKQRSLTDEPTVFLDPNTLSADGTIALKEKVFSEDGSLLAYSFSESGADWKKIKVRNVETGEDYPDLLKGIKFTTMSWTNDNKGFFYCRFPYQENSTDIGVIENQKLFYHRVGEPQEKDILVVEFPENPSWLMLASVSHCGKYLILLIALNERNNLLYVADLEKNGPIVGQITLTPIFNRFEADFRYITNSGSRALFHTNKDAPNYRLVEIDFNNYAENNWSTFIKENERDVLADAKCVDKDKIVLTYLHDVKSALQVHSLETGELIRTFPLEIGQIIEFSGDRKHSEIFYQLESFLTPGTVYQYDFSKANIEPTVLFETNLNINRFNKNNFTVEQAFYPSRDGTKIPMFVMQKKTKSTGPKPCLLHAYGGFNVPLLPHFYVPFLFFISEFDGILAIANIRGGGEYGIKWHDSGRILNKQNGFDDFQAAAKYLVENKYTEHNMIAIKGASNGGLLVGASITQRPELFGAAIAQVGVMDMLRFHKFTIGRAWISEYGNPDEKIHFENIYKYSPLHNIRPPNSTKNQFPSTLIITADHDDRVSPLHSFKFTAELQNIVRFNEFQKNPILLKIFNNVGHGEGKPIAKQIEEETDILTFLQKTLKIHSNIPMNGGFNC